MTHRAVLGAPARCHPTGISRRLLAVLAASLPFGATTEAAAVPGRIRVAYHLSDIEKVGFVLTNIRNHLAGTAEDGPADILLVVHGPALAAFASASADPATVEALASLREGGLRAEACAHTLEALAIDASGLLPGFAVAVRGGVVRLAELQTAGYAYLRP